MEVRQRRQPTSVNEEEGMHGGSAEEDGDCLEKARGPREGQAQMGPVDSNFMGTPATHLWVEGFQKSSLFCLSSRHSWLGQGQTIAPSRGLWGVTLDNVGDPWVMFGGATRPHSTPTPACSEMPIGYSGAHTVCQQMVLNVGIIFLYTV